MTVDVPPQRTVVRALRFVPEAERVAFTPDGHSFVIGDTENHRIRRVTP